MPISSIYVEHMEKHRNGIREPEKPILAAIARHFRVTVEELRYEDYSKIPSLNFDNIFFLQKIDTILPILSTEEALKNELFNKACVLHHKFYEGLKKGRADDLELSFKCFDYYEKAEKDEKCWHECAANLLALYYLFLLFLKTPAELSKAPASILQVAKRNFKVREMLDDPDIEFEKEAAQLFSESLSDDEFQDEMTKYKYALKTSALWSDLADYYLALQYVWGFVDNNLTCEFNRRIGIEMLNNLVSVKNPYAIDYILIDFEASGIKSSQPVDDKS